MTETRDLSLFVSKPPRDLEAKQRSADADPPKTGRDPKRRELLPPPLLRRLDRDCRDAAIDVDDPAFCSSALDVAEAAIEPLVAVRIQLRQKHQRCLDRVAIALHIGPNDCPLRQHVHPKPAQSSVYFKYDPFAFSRGYLASFNAIFS